MFAIFKCYLGSKEERFSPSSTSSQTPPPSDRKYSSLKIADLNQSGSSESDKTGSCHSSILRSQSSQLLAKAPLIMINHALSTKRRKLCFFHYPRTCILNIMKLTPIFKKTNWHPCMFMRKQTGTPACLCENKLHLNRQHPLCMSCSSMLSYDITCNFFWNCSFVNIWIDNDVLQFHTI